MIKEFTFIKETIIRGVRKDRWECPFCKEDKDQSECRFNLSRKKRGRFHRCKFCQRALHLNKY